MLMYPDIDPVALQLGPLSIRWYGLMYLVGFVSAYLLLVQRAKKPNSGWTSEMVGDFIFYCAIGVVVGGRVGYVLFYSFGELLQDPLSLIRIWEGGMSFHGGFLGVFVAAWLFGRRTKKYVWDILDYGIPVVPIGLGAGRIGNFIGGELVGRTTDVPWGMVFPHVDNLPRHPSQLYQACLEGLVLFAITWWFSSKPRPRYAVSGLMILLYSLFRMGVEFVRAPDAHIGFIAFGWVTMGQVLTLPMFVLGAVLLFLAYGRPSQR